MAGSSSIPSLALIGNGGVAALLEAAGIRLLSDIWGVDMDAIVPQLLQAARQLANAGEHPDVHWDNILVRAFNRVIMVHEAERFEPDIPLEYRCSISHQWLQHPVAAAPSPYSGRPPLRSQVD